MTLGWTLVPDGEYRVDSDAKLNPAQTRLLGQLLESFSPPAVCHAENVTLEQSLRRQLQSLCASGRISLRADTLECQSRLAVLELKGFGPFSPLLADDDLEEIVVIGVGKLVFVCHWKRGWLKTSASPAARIFQPLAKRSVQIPFGVAESVAGPCALTR